MVSLRFVALGYKNLAPTLGRPLAPVGFFLEHKLPPLPLSCVVGSKGDAREDYRLLQSGYISDSESFKSVSASVPVTVVDSEQMKSVTVAVFFLISKSTSYTEV